MALSLTDIETNVAYFESRGQNILNCCASAQCSSSPNCAPMRAGIPQTASGFFQITNTLWNAEAPKAGVSTTQYPTAMSAPAATQTQVFGQIYADRQLQDWSGNSALMAAIQSGSVQTTTGFDPALTAAISGNAQAQPAQASGMTQQQWNDAFGAQGGAPIFTTPQQAADAMKGGGFGAAGEAVSNAVSGVEKWASAAAVEIGLAVLAIGFIFFALSGAAKTVIQTVKP